VKTDAEESRVRVETGAEKLCYASEERCETRVPKHAASEWSFIPRAFIREGDTYKSER